MEILHTLNRFVSEGRVTNRTEFESKLQCLVEIARSGDGRQKLALAEAVPTLLSLSGGVFPRTRQDLYETYWSFRSFNLYVKVLRNLCAGNLVNQEALVSLDGVKAIAPVLEILAQECSAPHSDSFENGESPAEAIVRSSVIESLQMVLQLLGNVAGLGEVSQARIWKRFFPSVFEIVAKVSNEKIQGPLCMVIYTCCRDNDSRCMELSEGKGASVVAWILNRGAGVVTDAAPNEWLEFLLPRLCFATPCFPALFCGLGDTGTNRNSSSQTPANVDVRSCLKGTSFTKEQASLLDILNAALSTQEEEKHSDDPSADPHRYISMPSTSASFLIDIIRSAAECAASTNLSVLHLPTLSPVADVLGLSLSMARILCVLDEKRSALLPKFASSGLIPLLLDLLRALGPPDSTKTTPRSTTQDIDTNGSRSHLDDTITTDSEQQSSSTSSDFKRFPRRDVYTGYRRDIVAVIANASHRSFLIQDSVREHGGLLLVLQQCMPDTNNPFLREWGLWAIRNLLEGNSANQSELADLEIRSTVPDSRLRDAGMTVEINPETGRPRLVNVAPNTDNPASDEFM